MEKRVLIPQIIKRGIKRYQNILERVSTGIPGLDSLIDKGFIEGSSNLIFGNAGSGKTIFAIQFIVEGIKKGESGIYVTFEERKDKMYENMKSFGWDLQKYEDEGKFVFLEYTPEQVKKILVEGGGQIEGLIEKLDAKRIVIDSITSFALLYDDELTKKEAALSLFDLISRWGCTAVMTSQQEREGITETNEVSSALEFEVDSIIILYHAKTDGIRKRALEILKMRGTKTPEKTFPITIDKKGISVYTKGIVRFR